MRLGYLVEADALWAWQGRGYESRTVHNLQFFELDCALSGVVFNVLGFCEDEDSVFAPVF